ncbi:MAG: sulfatase [Planctomycetaceae bacterium]|nr:sulfatase [Planctomycetaceae bacterium]
MHRLPAVLISVARSAVLLIAAGAVFCRASNVGADDRPHIILFYIDDLGWKDVGFMGSTYYETPHIDRLAAEGMIFTSAYSNGPNCAPSRASLMSGQYTPRHGVYTVGETDRGDERFRKLLTVKNRMVLRDEFVTVAETLQAAGYQTASLGKWHVGDDPTTQGFDINIAGGTAGSPGRGRYHSPYFYPNCEQPEPGEYLTDRLTSEAVNFITQHADEPFFLYLPHYAVHVPIEPKPAVEVKYARKQTTPEHFHPGYAALIESVDDSVGAVLAEVERLGLTDRTVVLFTSDNGGHGVVTRMTPLRGSKGMLYEGGVRVPFAVKWPGHIEPGSRCDVPVIGLDIYPTLLELTHTPRPEGYLLDGESLVPLLTQSGSLQRDAIYWHFPAYLPSNPGADVPFRTTPAGAVRMGDYKLIEFFEDGRRELYNLAEDIGEQHNLFDERPETAARLHTRLQAWRESVNAPVPTEPNPKYDPTAVWIDAR